MRSRILIPGLFLLTPFLASCGDSTSAPVPARIVVTPGSVTLDALGLTQQFSAKVEDKKGRVVEGVAITWTSMNAQVASVDPSGTATALMKGTASIQASAEGLTGRATLTVNPLPAAIEKTAGDSQSGALSQPLPEELEVEIRDAMGNPVQGAQVSFSVLVGAGSITPAVTLTDAQGRARASWTLGCSNDDPQRARASAGGYTAEFTASADLSLPAICQEAIPNGRVTFAYSEEIEVVGGDQATMTWTVESGFLPPGIDLSDSGFLAGIPTEPGSYTFRALAQDGMGQSASRQFTLQVCEAPLALAPGETASPKASGPDGCGFFLPSGTAGDRYRIGLLWPTSLPGDTTDLPLVTVTTSKTAAIGISAEPAPVQRYAPAIEEPGDWMDGLPGGLGKAMRVEAATEAFHHRLREQEARMIREMGNRARLLPDAGSALQAFGAQSPAPDKLVLLENANSQCSPETRRVTSLKVAENEYLAFYQDSAQAQVDSLRVTQALAQMMLDYYRDYGKQVIDTYFGGVTDINGDDRVVVLATPVVGSEVAAYVWSGDFFEREASFPCPNSNEMELIRFNAAVIRGMLNGNYQPLATLVHEMKHVSSLYQSIRRFYALDQTNFYQPGWVEEGTAEIAGEMSSRLAWETVGGPSLTATVDSLARRTAYEPGTGAPKKEAYGVLLRWARTILYLGSQPNGVVGTPTGAHGGHSVYGSGWHFHRWLGDAYGDATAIRLGDGPFFTNLNDSLTAVGPQGIGDATGLSWPSLLTQYASAIMLSGTGAPQPAWGFTNYDFPDVTSKPKLLTNQRSGFYPWPTNVSGDTETSQTFTSLVSSGYLGPSGIRIYDFSSDGAGLGMEVKVETTRSPVQVVVVRIQ